MLCTFHDILMTISMDAIIALSYIIFVENQNKINFRLYLYYHIRIIGTISPIISCN